MVCNLIKYGRFNQINAETCKDCDDTDCEFYNLRETLIEKLGESLNAIERTTEDIRSSLKEMTEDELRELKEKIGLVELNIGSLAPF